jgi:hypothetical protein
MHVPECSFPGKQKQYFSMGRYVENIKDFACCSNDSLYMRRCRITSMEYEDSVFFEASLCFVGKQILYFLVLNWQFGHVSDPDQFISSTYTIVLQIYAIIIEEITARSTSSLFRLPY